MKKDTFLWLTIGFGVGLIVSAAMTLDCFREEHRRREDPRLKQAETLLDEAEALLKNAKKSVH